MAKVSPLRKRMIEDMTIRNLSRSTRQSYVYAVAKFSQHFQCPPDRIGMEEVRAYQLHLVDQKYSWAHINQVACALRFFYGITLGRKDTIERIVSGREPKKLPPVLNREEIVRFLEQRRTAKQQLEAIGKVGAGRAALSRGGGRGRRGG